MNFCARKFKEIASLIKVRSTLTVIWNHVSDSGKSNAPKGAPLHSVARVCLIYPNQKRDSKS